MQLRYVFSLPVAAAVLCGTVLTAPGAKAAAASHQPAQAVKIASRVVPAHGKPAAKIAVRPRQLAAAFPAARRAVAQSNPKSRLTTAAGNKPVDPRSAKLQRARSVAEARPTAVRCVGRAQMGRAAWYGGTYIGRRTTSGETLDTIHATAAHRTLPLNSLARVTNLSNGRSVIVRVTDRGPISTSLLIDMSPRAAEELAMTQAGIVPVKVEQVVEVPTGAK